LRIENNFARESKHWQLKSVDQIVTFKCLGANIMSNRNLKEEMQIQTIKAAMMSGYLRDIIWRNKYISLRSKIRIYKGYVKLV